MDLINKYLGEGSPPKKFLEAVVKKLKAEKKKRTLTDKEQKKLDQAEQELGL